MPGSRKLGQLRLRIRPVPLDHGLSRLAQSHPQFGRLEHLGLIAPTQQPADEVGEAAHLEGHDKASVVAVIGNPIVGAGFTDIAGNHLIEAHTNDELTIIPLRLIRSEPPGPGERFGQRHWRFDPIEAEVAQIMASGIEGDKVPGAADVDQAVGIDLAPVAGP